MKTFHCGRFTLDVSRPLVMGIINLTDDSFSGDGFCGEVNQAIDYGFRMVEQGAHMLDLGAESSRPGAEAVPAQQEIDRVIPVLEGLRNCGVPLSIDTTKTGVIKAAISAGADMINDIQAMRTPGALEAVARSQVGICLMHMQGKPRSMQDSPMYADVVHEVTEFLSKRIAAAQAAGISANRISIDPGFGFGKTLEHNLELLKRLDEMLLPDSPMVVGLSRKSMLGLITGRPAAGRVVASVAANLIAVGKGARILRVHDVEMMLDALAVLQAVESDK